MVHMQWSLADVRRIRLSVWTIISSSFAYDSTKGGGGGIHRDTNKGENSDKIQAMFSSHYFIFCQVALLGFQIIL